jgi:hypothetical protein
MTYTKITPSGVFPLDPEELAEVKLAEQNRERLIAEAAATEYQRLRAAEYPAMAEYIDGVVKGDQAQIDKYIADCLAVKAKYPKPSAE